MIQLQFGMPLFLMGFYGGVMVLAVLAIRFLFGKWLPKRVIPVLWALVLVRLLVPFSVSSPLSLPVPGFLEDMWSGTSWAEFDQVALLDRGLNAVYDVVPKEQATSLASEEIVFHSSPPEAVAQVTEDSSSIDWEFATVLSSAPSLMGQLGMGFGGIGQAEGRVAKALGMKVLAYDVYPNDSGREIAEYVDLDALLARSDVITLHCNLTPENTGFINRDSIAKMKDGVILINNARGQLIHEQDVADALNSGKMGAAALDVVYTEPIRADNPLLQAKNCIITPHISWAPKESRQRIMDCAVANVRAYLEGSPINVVNLK